MRTPPPATAVAPPSVTAGSADQQPGGQQRHLQEVTAPVVFVSVGTDVHPFSRLLGWVADLAGEFEGRARFVVQRGWTTDPFPGSDGAGGTAHLTGPGAPRTFDFLDWDRLCELMAGADLVISHGGPTTIAEARRFGCRPVVVARDPDLGEHVDDHQQLFARRVAEQDLAEVVTSYAGLRAAVRSVVADRGAYRITAGTAAAGAPTSAAAVEFGRIVGDLFPPWPATVADVLEADAGGGVLRLFPPGRRIPVGPPDGPSPWVLERYRVLPAAGRPRYLLDVRVTGSLASTLGGYARLRPGRRALLRGLGVAAVRGRSAVLPDSGIACLVASGATPPESLNAFLGRLLGREVRLAFPVRPDDPHHKPTVQVLDTDGATVAFAKLGPTPATAARVATEEAALVRLARALPAGGAVRVPEVLGSGVWGSTAVVLTAPLPSDARSVPLGALASTVAASRAIGAVSGVRYAPLRDSAGVAELVADARRLSWPDSDGAPGAVRPLAAAAATLLAHHGDVVLGLGFRHGDWVPWNLARVSVRRPGEPARDVLWAFDLEHAAREAPLGVDLARGLTHVRRQQTGHDVAAALAGARSGALEILAELGLSARAADAVLAVHALDEAVRALRTAEPAGPAVANRGAGGRWPVGTDATVVQALAALASRPPVAAAGAAAGA